MPADDLSDFKRMAEGAPAYRRPPLDLPSMSDPFGDLLSKYDGKQIDVEGLASSFKSGTLHVTDERYLVLEMKDGNKYHIPGTAVLFLLERGDETPLLRLIYSGY